jgi:hypothetical protein
MPYEALRLEIHDRIATLTLNRPEAYNALNAQLAGELLDATTHTWPRPPLHRWGIPPTHRSLFSGRHLRRAMLPKFSTHKTRVWAMMRKHFPLAFIKS